MKIIIFLIVMLATKSDLSGSEVEIANGHYAGDHPQFSEINSIIESADRTLVCIDANQYTMDIGRIEGNARRLLSFTLNDLDLFLRNEKHKETIVVTVAKGVVPSGSNEKEKFINAIVDSVVPFGYKNIIVNGSNSVGVIVILAHKVSK